MGESLKFITASFIITLFFALVMCIVSSQAEGVVGTSPSSAVIKETTDSSTTATELKQNISVHQDINVVGDNNQVTVINNYNTSSESNVVEEQ